MESRNKGELSHSHEGAEIRTMPRDSVGEEEEEEGDDKGTLLSWDAILPDELLQKVLSLLPIANIIKSSIVCKRWYEVVHSCPPMSWEMMAPQKSLFFRSCFNDCAFSGIVYDPCLLRWCNFDFPRLEKGIWCTSSSCGLVCLMNPNDGSRLLVGNPIKRDWKQLPQVPACSFPHYNALALSFDRRTRGYTVVVAKCSRTPQLPGKSKQWHLSVHVYQSTTKSWVTPFAQDLGLWIGSYEAVICDGVLYYFMSHQDLTTPHLIAFNLMKPPSSIQSLLQESIPAPYPLICTGLINLSNKLVMVAMKDYGAHEGVVILELEDKTWREVAQMPISMYKDLRCKYLIWCCGVGDFLFMHASMWSVPLTFDMRQKVWKWSSHPYLEQLDFCNRPESLFYCGFCFEPRLDVSS
ncbi:F-box/kelch-repeat protein At3g61590-like [Zingiber officinale]|uniref:F-box/kelch-repeat protein At3g61590-like n=1 Tax=Zingiber officinale TaxID=94328 RepID=UPI001C4BE4A0|nr:F-box/kelch-repeat protein At3g61590-like [Zingiber officinale]